MEEFAGKTAVITGAGSGMGKAFATRWTERKSTCLDRDKTFQPN